MKAKAYSYIRFSTPEQAKGHSMQRQIALRERYCREHNLELASTEEYLFLDRGKSAYAGDHVGESGQLKRFYNLVNDGTIPRGSYLIVESLDRLSREKVRTALARFMDLLAAGITVVSLADGRTYKPDSEDDTELIVSILVMARAHEESSLKAFRLGAVWKQKKDQALTSKTPIGNVAPLWLEYTDKKNYAINESRVEIVRRIFKMTINGYGKAAVARILNSEEIPSFKGTSWGPSSVDKILKNRAVLGEYQPHTQVGKVKREPIGPAIPEYYPRAITDDIFYSAAAAVETRRINKSTKQSKNFNVWQGITQCAKCAATMHLVNKGVAPKGSIYLCCSNSRKGLCKSKYVRLDRSEVVFRELLAKVDSLALVQDAASKIQQQLDALEGQIIGQRIKHHEFVQALDTSFSAALAAHISKCEQQISQLEATKLKLLSDLANEDIVDKHDFFAKLDLVSYEGRNRANLLLKRLNIRIGISVEDKGIFYSVFQQAQPFIIFVQDKENVRAIPFSTLASDRIMSQDFDGTIKSAFTLLATNFVSQQDILTEEYIDEKIDELFRMN